jgi:hypothetical protein
MQVIDQVASVVRRVSFAVLVIILATSAGGAPLPGARAMQAPAMSQIRIVHGIADAGPLDVYIDGSLALIGIDFGDVSDEIALPSGRRNLAVTPTGSGPDKAIVSGQIVLEANTHYYVSLLGSGRRNLAVTPTGSGPDKAIVSGPIVLEANTHYYVSLLGSGDQASVGLFRIDDRPLELGRARFRVINGIADAGEIVPVFTGGDALSEPLNFGDVTDYATVDAGTYDLDILDNVSGASILSLPQTPFAEGAVTDILLVGLVADGTQEALIETAPVEVTRPAGLAASIVGGTCTGPGAPVADLGVVRPGVGDNVGVAGATSVTQGFGQAAVPFDTLLADPHAVLVEEGTAGRVFACGNIGGHLTETGALVVALQAADSPQLAGVAVLAPNVDDPDTTGVSVFVIAPAAPAAAATPVVSG